MAHYAQAIVGYLPFRSSACHTYVVCGCQEQRGTSMTSPQQLWQAYTSRNFISKSQINDMITDLEISGYKGLRSLRLEGLKRITLIGGRNNAGKTSVLEAIFTACDWGNPELLTRHLHWRGVDAFQANAEAWSSAFSEFDLRGKIQIKIKNSDGGREAFLAQVVEDGKGTLPTSPSVGSADNVRAPGEPSLRLSYTKSSRPIFEAVVVVTRGVPPYAFKSSKASDTAPRAHYANARSRTPAPEDALRFGVLDQNKQTAPVIESLRIIEPRLVGLSVIPVGPQSLLYADVEGLPRKVPVNLLGDGVTRLLSLLLQISNLQNGYLLVDEIENGFHHETLPNIWRAIYHAAKVQRCQIFATTHSYECLTAYSDCLSDVAPEDYSFVRLDRTRKRGGGTERDSESISATQYDAESLRNAIAGQWEVR